MSPLGDSTESVVKEVQLIHLNKEGRGLLYSSSGAFSITIGRTRCDVSFENDRYMSPIHAKLEHSIEGLKIIDAGSLNGIFKKVRNSTTIRPSDVFICGSQILKFIGLISKITPYVLPDGTYFYGSTIPDKEYIMIQQILMSRKMGDLYLKTSPVSIGREKGDILFPADKFLSALHCSIVKTEQGFQLNDLNSANGVYLKVRGSEILNDGDILLMGQELMMVRIIQK
jgi:pSer/pThr/pTyr-binding forkhead associated (FHA) protein